MPGFIKSAVAGVALLLLIQVLFSSDAYAITRVVNDRKGIIDDGAELFTAEQEKLLLERITKILDRGNAAVITVSENSGAAREIAESKYRELFGNANGTLLLIDADSGSIQFFSRGENNSIINDGRSREITDSVSQYAEKGDYFKCTDEALRQAVDLLDGDRIVSVYRHAAPCLLGIGTALLTSIWIVLSRRRLRAKKDTD